MLKKSISILFLGLITLFTACKKDVSTTPPPVAVVLPPPFMLSVSIPSTAPHGVFTITTNDTASETVLIYDRWGRNVFNQTINGTTTIDIVGLQTGAYVYELITRTKTLRGYITFIY